MFWIPTKNFPPKGFQAITLWPFCFYREEFELTEADRKHERVHQRQYLICLGMGLIVLVLKIWLLPNWILWPFIVLPFVLFYIAYGITWAIKGYKNMKMEENALNLKH